MEISQLRAILALQDLASFAKAGKHLHLSPPAVFGQIRQLEDALGQRLYERAGKRLELTPAGRDLAEYAKTILETHDAAMAALKAGDNRDGGILRIGCGPHSSLRILPELLRAFLKKNPHTDIRLITGDDPPLLRDLEAGSLDAVFMSLPVHGPALKQDALWQYEMVLVVAPAGARGSRNKLPKIEELQGAPFILYRRLLVVDDAINRLCASLGLNRNVVMESDQPDAIKELVKLGLGIAVLPLWSVGDDARQGKLRIVRPKTRQLYQYGMLYRRSGYQPHNLSALIDTAHEWPQWWPLARHVAPLRA